MTEIQNSKHMILKKESKLKKILSINTVKKQKSLGHWYLEFEICLDFGA